MGGGGGGVCVGGGCMNANPHELVYGIWYGMCVHVSLLQLFFIAPRCKQWSTCSGKSVPIPAASSAWATSGKVLSSYPCGSPSQPQTTRVWHFKLQRRLLICPSFVLNWVVMLTRVPTAGQPRSTRVSFYTITY